jgi:hypothetical protein
MTIAAELPGFGPDLPTNCRIFYNLSGEDHEIPQ